jgi:hypothetical protein
MVFQNAGNFCPNELKYPLCSLEYTKMAIQCFSGLLDGAVLLISRRGLSGKVSTLKTPLEALTPRSVAANQLIYISRKTRIHQLLNLNAML